MNTAAVDKLTNDITLYIPIVILFVGNIGSFLNLLTFTSKELRRNSCGWYFLMSSLFDISLINFSIITRLCSDHFGSNYQNTSRTYCKLRIYTTWTLPCISTAYLVLSSLDRCWSTSEKTRYRAFSQIKVAYRITIVPIILYCLTNSHQFFYFDLRPKCVAQPGAYSIFLSMYSIVWTSLIPQSLLLIFGLMTYRNIRISRRRLTQEMKTDKKKSRTDMHLIKMTLIQVIGSTILLNIRTIYYAYSVLSPDAGKSDLQKAWENFLYQISNYFFYANFCKSFYLNTLMSNLFRQVLLKRLKLCLSKIAPEKFRIHPTTTSNATVN
ncbi:unnamed protein product [Adineta ricciae]|uniref:G-protein coupled receptors family 1 profile domain-containing protein n=1 Tax=Adineta ricciae TaxID=249248 RepID=A0A815LUM0_ADIRI|nr:unnamed protein product [Adineta ricciae]CAF1414168.1 unnamed protein product [Adineta ricciae]